MKRSRPSLPGALIALLLITSAAVPVVDPRPALGAEACTTTIMAGTIDPQAVVDASPEGATICFEPGTYRLEGPLHPRPGQKLVGQMGAVLNGAKVVTGFVPAGADFVAPGFLPAKPSEEGLCLKPGCSYAQDVFLDGVPLARVTTRGDLASGKFFEDFADNRIYLRDDPTGRLVEQAYATGLVASDNTGVTVKGLVLEKAANEGGLNAALSAGGDDWTIQANEVRFNHGSGVECGTCTVQRNFVHHNGQLGVGGVYGSNQLFESNEVSYNNTAGYDSFWAAGGSKWVLTEALVVRGNYFHDNAGTGIWTDANNTNTTIDGNYVSDNTDFGILHEISYRARITNNVVIGNGHNPASDLDGVNGGIRVAQSPDVEVAGNTLIGNRNSIQGLQLRSEDQGTSGPHELQNLDVHDNDVSMIAGITGVNQLDDDPSYFSSRNNRFHGNHYHLDSLEARRFAWADADHDAAAWRRFGQDTTGTFDTSISPVPSPPRMAVGPQASSSGGTTATPARSSTEGPAATDERRLVGAFERPCRAGLGEAPFVHGASPAARFRHAVPVGEALQGLTPGGYGAGGNEPPRSSAAEQAGQAPDG